MIFLCDMRRKLLPRMIKLRFITRPNCALDRRTILCLYVAGFQRQVFKYVPKCKWIPLTKFQWIPRTKTCNVNAVGTFVLLRIPQQANTASSSGFRNCKWVHVHAQNNHDTRHQPIKRKAK